MSSRDFSLGQSYDLEAAWWSECKTLDGTVGKFIYVPGQFPKATVLVNAPFSMGYDFKGKLFARLTSGLYVSLWNIRVSKQTLSTSQLHSIEIVGSIALVGRDLYKENKETFRHAKAEYSDLAELLAYHPFSSDINEKPQGVFSSTWTHLSKERESFYVQPIRARVSYYNGYNVNSNDGTLEIQQRDQLKIKPLKKSTLWWYLDQIDSLETVTEMLFQRTMSPVRISLQRSKRKDKSSEDNRPIYVLFRINKQRLQGKSSLFSTKPILPSNSFRKYMQGWFGLRESCLESSIRMRDLLFENKATMKELTLILQVFETAFNEHPSGRLVSRAAYRRIRKSINACLEEHEDSTPDLVESLDRALQYSNSGKLTDRLLNISSLVNSEVLDKIFKKDITEEIAKIVKSRNNYTHGVKKKKTGTNQAYETRLQCITIFRFVWVLLLLEIGVNPDEIMFDD